MPVRRLRALAVALAGTIVAAGLSVYASPPPALPLRLESGARYDLARRTIL